MDIRKPKLATRINCCNDCPRKGCGAYHDSCEKYQEQKAKSIAEREEILKQHANKRVIHTQQHLPKAGGYFKNRGMYK